MKHVRVQFSLAVLLAAVAVPLVAHNPRVAETSKTTANSLQTPSATAVVMVVAPDLVADGLPTPWPKKPAFATPDTMMESPKLIANILPTPWPKKPGADAATRILMANVWPTPWPKKPEAAQS